MIIFLTNFIQYAPEGFEVQAFRYLLKTNMQERLVSYFEDAVKEVVRKKQIITISVNSELIDIPVNHILYLESNLRMHLRGGIVLPSSAKSHKELKQHYLKWRGKNRWAIS